MKSIKFYYDKNMFASFEEGKKQFEKETMIVLDGIKWYIKDNSLIIEITKEQQEKWLFHLALCIGQEIQKELHLCNSK